MKNILITGIAGFIGSATAREMVKRGYTVCGVDNFNDYYNPDIKMARAKVLKELGVEVIELDLQKQSIKDLLVKKSIDAVLHIAASAGVRPSINNPAFFVKNNILVTTMVLDAMANANVNNFVFASSSSVYGNSILNTDKPLKESDSKKEIFSPYAATKLSCEAMVDVYSNINGIKSTSLRYFTVFGPDQRPDLAIIKFMRGILEGKPIDKYGAGETFRDYTYISDVVEANIKAIEFNDGKTSKHDVMNISSKNPITLNNLIKLIEKKVGASATINQMSLQKGDVTGTFGDNAKAEILMGWRPTVIFEEGIANTLKWLKEEK